MAKIDAKEEILKLFRGFNIINKNILLLILFIFISVIKDIETI